MAEDPRTIQDYFNGIVAQVHGLTSLIVADKDGIIVLRASRGAAKEFTADEALVPVYVTVAEQCSKMDMGKNKSLLTFSKDQAFVHLNASPFVIACIGKSNMNTGLLLSLADEMIAAVSGLSLA